jgi:hypothetical protein
MKQLLKLQGLKKREWNFLRTKRMKILLKIDYLKLLYIFFWIVIKFNFEMITNVWNFKYLIINDGVVPNNYYTSFFNFHSLSKQMTVNYFFFKLILNDVRVLNNWRLSLQNYSIINFLYFINIEWNVSILLLLLLHNFQFFQY